MAKKDNQVWTVIIIVVALIIIATNYDIFKNGLNHCLSLCNLSHSLLK